MKARTLSAIAMAMLFAAAPAFAQDKKKDAAKKESAPVTKVHLDNDKVRVAETTFKPEDVSRADRKARVSYTIQGSKIERTTKDGKKTVVERKKGDVVWLEADSDAVKNIGTGNFQVLTIQLK